MYALVTGASSGIGMESAYILAQKGYDLIVVARSLDKLEKLKNTINNEYNREVIVLPLDLTNRDDIEKLFAETKDFEIEVLVNNAGLGKVGMYNEVSNQDDYNMIDLNVTAMHMILKHYTDVMNKGYTLTVGSIASFVPGPRMATYYASKNYIRAYAEAVRYELKKMKKNIGVTVLCPGPVQTNFNNVANVKFDLKGIDAKKCANYAIKRMFKKKKFATPKFTVRSATRFLRILPHSMTMGICYKNQKKKG